jgi:hypothetical protein
MFRNHIDFFAVFLIAVTMFALSQLTSLRFPGLDEQIHIQTALFK